MAADAPNTMSDSDRNIKTLTITLTLTLKHLTTTLIPRRRIGRQGFDSVGARSVSDLAWPWAPGFTGFA